MSDKPDEPFAAIETSRLRIRCTRVQDAGVVANLMTPGVSQWLASWPTPFTREMAAARIENCRSLAYARRGMSCVIEKSGEVIGWIESQVLVEDRKCAALGYWLGERHQRHGYVREAAATFVPAAFEFLNVAKIEAGAQPGNAGSFSIMRGLGMRFVDRRKVLAESRGREEICPFYAISRPLIAEPASE